MQCSKNPVIELMVEGNTKLQSKEINLEEGIIGTSFYEDREQTHAKTVHNQD